MSIAKAYEEVVDFIAAKSDPESLLQFKPSDQARERVFALVEKEKTTGLSEDEKSELDLCMQVEHLMRMAKAKAQLRVSHG
jgi:hypothetical protein